MAESFRISGAPQVFFVPWWSYMGKKNVVFSSSVVGNAYNGLPKSLWKWMDWMDWNDRSSPKTLRGIASFWAVGCGFGAPESFQESLHGEWWLNDAVSEKRTFSSGESMVGYADSSENDCPSRHATYDLVYQEAIETGMDQKIKFLGQIDSQRMKILSTLLPANLESRLLTMGQAAKACLRLSVSSCQ